MVEVTMHIAVKTLPDTIKTALKSVQYGKVDIAVQVVDAVSPYSEGSQGRKGFVLILDIQSGDAQKTEGDWGGAGLGYRQVDLDDRNYNIQPGFAVVKGTEGYGGTFATLYVHPNNFAKFLPETASITDREKNILKQFSGLTSAGRKYEWDNYPESRPSDDELSSLVERGLLSRNRTGATKITTDGKNAISK